jgi:predicted NBD/HSP70 family sugar kinase
VGTGIYLHGRLLRGEQGLAGELGHLTVSENGPLCRCGKSGCLEVLVNQRALFRAYCAEVLGLPREPDRPVPDEELPTGLADLFSRAANGEGRAVEVVGRAAEYLGRGVATMLTVLNVRRVVVAGNFGPDGGSLLPPLEAAIRKQVLPGTEFLLSYVPLEKIAFARGASLLILKEFLALPGEGHTAHELDSRDGY